MGRLSITSHAVERFQERWAPHLTVDEVRQELEQVASDARPQKNRTVKGQELWASACLGRKILFVVKRDMGHWICVTVLPQGATEATMVGPDMEEYLEFQREREEDQVRMQQLLLENQRELGRVCQVCDKGEVVRYSRKMEKRICQGCYVKAKNKGDAGKCPLIEDWERWEREGHP